MASLHSSEVNTFIERWRTSGAAERANYALFLSELCDILKVPRPEPTKEIEEDNKYVFEKAVTFYHPDGSTSPGRIDLYKEGCFVLEAKQGSAATENLPKQPMPLLKELKHTRRSGTARRGTQRWDQSMLEAHGQALQYARALPKWPPFVLVVDVGHVIEIYSDFERQGKTYLPFPDARSHRIYLEDLRDEALREWLSDIWINPMGLDPSQRAEEVTLEVAKNLADLAMSLEVHHDPQIVADFLMRCLFTMFAEDVGLLPEDCFTTLLEELKDKPNVLQQMIESLWRDMDKGGFSIALREKVLRFNGRFFCNPHAVLLDSSQVELLAKAASLHRLSS